MKTNWVKILGTIGLLGGMISLSKLMLPLSADKFQAPALGIVLFLFAFILLEINQNLKK